MQTKDQTVKVSKLSQGDKTNCRVTRHQFSDGKYEYVSTLTVKIIKL
jgi:hypothetical protein